MNWPPSGFTVGILIGGSAACIWVWRTWKAAKEQANLIARLAPALVELPQFYALMDRQSPRSHYIERHGPLLGAGDILERATRGSIAFSGVVGRRTSSTRWFRHADLLLAIDSALDHWHRGERPKGGVFDFVFPHPIGEGFRANSSRLLQTSHAKVIIRDGEVVTAYPFVAAQNVNS